MVNLLEPFGVPGFLWDIVAMFITLFATICVIFLVGVFYRKGWIRDDMLLIANHVYVAPIAILTWVLYSNEIQSRYLAAFTPAIFAILFILILTGKFKNEKLIRMITTSENLSELRAPLIYSLVISVLTVLCWPIPLDSMGYPNYYNYIPTMLLVVGPWTGGWGMGHYVNRKWGRRKLGVMENRSVEGGLAIFVFSIISIYILLFFYWFSFFFQHSSSLGFLSFSLLISIVIISVVTTIIETVGPSIYDNALIPTGIILTLFLLTFIGFYGYPIFNF